MGVGGAVAAAANNVLLPLLIPHLLMGSLDRFVFCGTVLYIIAVAAEAIDPF